MRFTKFLAESINDKAIFKACFISGCPGAGKSYTIKKLTSGSISPKVINSDKYTEYFGDGGNVDWNIYGEKIEKLSIASLYQYINSMLPLWIDSTSSNPACTLNRVNILESLGWDVAMIWVNTSLESALKRNANRKRHVPEEFLIDVYNRSQKVKPFFKNKFSNFWEIYNSGGELTDSIILNAFKNVNSFYMAPVQNTIGKNNIQNINKYKYKYLDDFLKHNNSELIKTKIQGWFY